MKQKGSHLSRQFPLLIFPHLQWLDCPPVGVIPLIYWSFAVTFYATIGCPGVLFCFKCRLLTTSHLCSCLSCMKSIETELKKKRKKKTCTTTSPAKELLSNPDLLIIIFNLIILIILTLKCSSFLFPKLVNVFNFSRSAQLFLI